jgi:hypothetical protein
MMNAENRSSASNRHLVPKQDFRPISLRLLQRELYASDIRRELPKGTKRIRVVSDEVRFKDPPDGSWRTLLEYTVPPFVYRRTDTGQLPKWHLGRLFPFILVVSRRARVQRVAIPYELATRLENDLGIPVERPPVYANGKISRREFEISNGLKPGIADLE